MNPTQSSLTLLVARREIISQLRSKSFIISTAILVVIVFALTIVGGIFGSRAAEPSQIAVMPETADVIEGQPLLVPVLVDSEEKAVALVKDGEVEAAVVPIPDAQEWPTFALLTTSDIPTALEWATTSYPPIEIIATGDDPGEATDEDAEEEFGLNYLVGLVYGLIFIMTVVTFGSTIAQNTVVEKQTRTVELLVSAVSPRTLLAGKILGNSALAIGQTTTIVLATILGLLVTGQGSLLGLLQASMLWFIVFFVFGFILFAAIFAASASLVSRIEDTGSVLMPVMMLAMAPYFVVIAFGTNPTVMAVASYVPFTSIVAMPVQIFTGAVSWWQPLISLAILIVSDYLAILAASRIYRASVLRTGSRVKLREAWAGDRD